jgi:hypothetical protein
MGEAGMALAVAGTFGVLLVLLAAGLSGLHRRYFAFLAERAAAGGGAASEAVAAARSAPFGLPEGTIRATLALLLVVAGVLALLFRRDLGDAGTGELVSILGTVVGFYFGARGVENGATAEARRAVAVAQAATTEATAARIEAAGARAADPVPAPVAAPVAEVAPRERERLQALRGHLADGRRLLAALAAVRGGPPLVEGADAVLARVDGTLAALGPLLSGRPDPAAVAVALAEGGETLEALERAGLPGVLGDAIAGVGGAMRALGDAGGAGAAFAASVGGPAGLVAAVAMGGLSLLGDRARHDAWTRRILDLPPARADLPDRPTAVDAALAVDSVPGLRARLTSDGVLRTDLALVLLEAAAVADAAGTLPPAGTVAAALSAWPEVAARFPDAAVLAEAVEGVRRAAAFARLRRLLPPTVEAPGSGPVPVDGLLAAVDALRADSHAAAEIDRLAALAMALGDLGPGLDARALLADGIARGADLAARERQSRRGEPEALR